MKMQEGQRKIGVHIISSTCLFCLRACSFAQSKCEMARIIKIAVSSEHYKNITLRSENLFRNNKNLELLYHEIPQDFNPEDWQSHWKDAEVGLLSPEIISKICNLTPSAKWIQSTWAGMDLLLKRITKDQRRNLQHCTFTRTGVFGQPMGEYVLGAIIAMERNFPRQMKNQLKSLWDKGDLSYRRLTSLSIGILGLGDIGMKTAKFCKSMGMTVFGLKRTRQLPSDDSPVDKIFLTSELEDMLSQSDYVCNVLPSTPETKHLLDGDVLKICQARKSKFINAGRGDIITEESLVKALTSGWLSGAFLDVFENEPLDKESPLWSMENVVITPHVAAISDSDTVADVFFENLINYVIGKPLKYVFDWETGY